MLILTPKDGNEEKELIKGFIRWSAIESFLLGLEKIPFLRSSNG